MVFFCPLHVRTTKSVQTGKFKLNLHFYVILQQNFADWTKESVWDSIQIDFSASSKLFSELCFPIKNETLLLVSTAPFCDITNRCHKDRKKSHNIVTDLNHINFIGLFYSFIYQQLLIKICWLFTNFIVNYQNPYFLHKYCHFFGREWAFE